MLLLMPPIFSVVVGASELQKVVISKYAPLSFSELVGKDYLLLANYEPRAALFLVFSLYFLKYRSKAKKLLFIKCSELNFACGKH